MFPETMSLNTPPRFQACQHKQQHSTKPTINTFQIALKLINLANNLKARLSAVLRSFNGYSPSPIPKTTDYRLLKPTIS